MKHYTDVLIVWNSDKRNIIWKPVNGFGKKINLLVSI